jgi:hypothetical protein
MLRRGHSVQEKFCLEDQRVESPEQALETLFMIVMLKEKRQMTFAFINLIKVK